MFFLLPKCYIPLYVGYLTRGASLFWRCYASHILTPTPSACCPSSERLSEVSIIRDSCYPVSHPAPPAPFRGGCKGGAWNLYTRQTVLRLPHISQCQMGLPAARSLLGWPYRPVLITAVLRSDWIHNLNTDMPSQGHPSLG